MTHEILNYVLISWVLLLGFSDTVSDNGADRLCGFITLLVGTTVLFCLDWIVK